MNGLIQKSKELYSRHRRVVSYLFFGVCSTVVNILCYFAAYEVMGLSNTASTVIAWSAAVIFAFFTNKILVFRSWSAGLSKRLGEIASFFGCRLMTGVLDVAIMAVAVDHLKWNGVLWKLISNVIVTVLNYVASRFLIFKNARE